MKTLVLVMCLLAAGASVYVAMADEAGMDADRSHPGAFITDSVITTKVKAKMAAKHLSTLAHIKVDTDKDGVVWLSGNAPTKDASDLATLVAKDTEGVRTVHNDIVIEP